MTSNKKDYLYSLPHDYLFRTIIVGNSRSGKSTFCKTYANGYSCVERTPTIGVDFISKKHKLDDGTIIRVNLWDTAGQEAFRSIIRSYYRDISGAIILFDLTDRESYKSVPTWLKDIRHFNSCKHNHPIVLVGNKSDLMTKRCIEHDEALLYANSENMLYVESSCYNVDNIETIMHHFYSHIYANFIENIECTGIKLSTESNDASFSSLRDSKASKAAKASKTISKCC